MDCAVLCWRDVALRKMRSQGVSGLQVEILVAYRGHPVETAVWGTVDKHAIAIKPGHKAQIECGRGEVVKLVGPQTAYQVLDAIQRAVRGDAPHKVYTSAEKATYHIRDCRRCPLQGFAGLVPVEGGGTPTYRVLWTHYFCHTGVPCSQVYPHIKLDKSRRVCHEFFLPENAINYKQPHSPRHHDQAPAQESEPAPTHSPHAAGSVGAPPARMPSWSAGSAERHASSPSSSPQKERREGQQQQQQQRNGQAGGKKRMSLPSALAALLQVK